MANLRVLVPDSTTNYVKNPSFRHNTDGWDIIATPWDVLYYLYDQFNTDVAAGSVNATNAEPVGGPRTVTDTNSKISIAGGVLDFATGAVAYDGAWYSSLTRQLGRTLLGRLIIGDVANSKQFGFDSNNSGSIDSAILMNSTNLYISTSGTLLLIGDVSATTYELCVITRASGTIYFIKGGAFTNWTIIYLTSGETYTPIYPGINVRTSTASVFTADNIRVPKRLFIPVPLQSDGFSAATTDGAGNAEANGPAGNAWTGATWGAAGGLASNTPTLGAELLTDGGLENWNSATDLTSWTEVLAGTSTVNREATTIHGGTYAARLDVDASNSLVYFYQALTIPAHTWFFHSVWCRSATGTPSFSFCDGTSGTIVTKSVDTTYTKYVLVERLSTANPNRGLKRQSATSNSVYFDDYSVTPITLSSLFRSLSHSSANVLADVAVTLTAGTQAGLVVNLDSAATPANFVIAYHDGTNAKLDKCVAGVYTNMISAAATYSAGAVIRVVKDGTSYRLFYNNAAVGSVTTIADAGIVSNTLHGLFSTYSANTFDNFVCWARGNEGQYSGLDAL